MAHVGVVRDVDVLIRDHVHLIEHLALQRLFYGEPRVWVLLKKPDQQLLEGDWDQVSIRDRDVGLFVPLHGLLGCLAVERPFPGQAHVEQDAD